MPGREAKAPGHGDAESTIQPISARAWAPVYCPRLPRELVGQRPLARLIPLLGYLHPSSLIALEARLGERPGPVDLSVRLHDSAQRRHVAPHVPVAHLRSLLAGGEHLPAGVRSVWLEFDMDRSPPPRGLPAPVVCARLPRDPDPARITDELLPLLHGRSLTPFQRQSFLRACAALPDDARPLYTFSLAARGGGAIRLELWGPRPERISGYLREIFPATRFELREALRLFAAVERIHLSFDLGADAVLPRIGLEGSFRRLPAREPGWRRLFDGLIAAGLCTPGEAAAALAWPGYETPASAGEHWPGEAPERYLVRSLSHVKVVLETGRAPAAKLYLLVQGLRRSPPS